MFNILRKLRRSLVESKSATKYLLYSIGEIALVVIGILIALQINNWNEFQKDRKEEYLALQSLHSEFLDNRNQFNRTQKFHRTMFDAMEYLLEVLETERININLEDSIYTCLARSSTGTPDFNPSGGIVNSLISSGKVNIIRNDSLKLYLIKWNDLVTDYREMERMTHEYKFTYLYPMVCSMTKLPSKQRPDLYMRNISHGEVDLNLLQSKEFYNYLSQCWVSSRFILVEDSPQSEGPQNEGRIIQEALDKIILLIEKELEE